MVKTRAKIKPSILMQRLKPIKQKRFNLGRLTVGVGTLKQSFVFRNVGKLPSWGTKDFMKKVEFFLLLSNNIPLKNFKTKEPNGPGTWVKCDNKSVVKLVNDQLKLGSNVKVGTKTVGGRIIKLR